MRMRARLCSFSVPTVPGAEPEAPVFREGMRAHTLWLRDQKGEAIVLSTDCSTDGTCGAAKLVPGTFARRVFPGAPAPLKRRTRRGAR